MSFLIRNIGVGDVEIGDLGITVDDGTDYDLTQEEPDAIRTSEDLPALISAGNIRVLDPLDGITLLSEADSLECVAVTNDPHFRIRGGELQQLDDVNMFGSPPLTDLDLLQWDGYNWVNVTTEDVIGVPPAPVGGSKIIQLKWGPIPGMVGTTAIPLTTSPPIITQGTELWSEDIDIQSDISTMRVSTNVVATASRASMQIVVTIFRNSIAIGMTASTISNKDKGHVISFAIYDEPAGTGFHTYSCRVGKSNGTGSWYINYLPLSNPTGGGLLENNAYTVEEIGEILE